MLRNLDIMAVVTRSTTCGRGCVPPVVFLVAEATVF